MGASAFAHNGKAHLYTGIRKAIKDEILGRQLSNQERAIRRAKATNAVMIDDTAIGAFLDKFEEEGVYEYFKAQTHLTPPQRFEEADKVWRYASRKFIEALWGDVTTSVCGAGRDRIFYQVEIPAMVEMVDALVTSNGIEAVNEVPMDKVRKLYEKDNYEATYRVICLGQLRQSLHEAHETELADIMSEFLDEREIYRLDRADFLSHIGLDKLPTVYTASAADRLNDKQARLQRFVADRLANGFPATPPTDIASSVPSRGLHL